MSKFQMKIMLFSKWKIKRISLVNYSFTCKLADAAKHIVYNIWRLWRHMSQQTTHVASLSGHLLIHSSETDNDKDWHSTEV